jgi:Ca2+-transporting ATPase
MLGAFLASCILMLAVLVLPFLQGVFEVIGMTGTQWGIVAILSIAPLIIMEIAKGIIKLLGNNR